MVVRTWLMNATPLCRVRQMLRSRDYSFSEFANEFNTILEVEPPKQPWPPIVLKCNWSQSTWEMHPIRLLIHSGREVSEFAELHWKGALICIMICAIPIAFGAILLDAFSQTAPWQALASIFVVLIASPTALMIAWVVTCLRAIRTLSSFVESLKDAMSS